MLVVRRQIATEDNKTQLDNSGKCRFVDVSAAQRGRQTTNHALQIERRPTSKVLYLSVSVERYNVPYSTADRRRRQLPQHISSV